MDGLVCVTLRQRPELKQRAAAWFHAKWGVPEGYIGVCSMSLGHSAVPQPKASPRKEGYILRV